MWSNQLERICFVLGLLFTIHSISQEEVVQPYLQKLTDQGVVVLWETEEANSWYLDWGLDQQQLQSVVSQSNSLLNTGHFIQRVELNNLDPSQRYVYRIKKDNYNSQFFSFKTEESVDAESATVLVATSDMQKDNSNPNICLLYTSPSPRD